MTRISFFCKITIICGIIYLDEFRIGINMNRYKDLKKENDQLMNNLGDSYLRIANIYVKKARGYAVRNEDTEVKIRDTLYILKKYSDSGALCNVVIKNESEFIESRMALLSKQYKDPEMIKGAIILAVLIVACIGWVVVSKYLSRKVHYEKPTAFIVSKVNDNKVTLTWREVALAQEYSLYYEVDGRTSSTYYSEECEYTFILEYGKTYTFYVYVAADDVFGKSEEISVTYTLNSKDS